MHEPSYTRCPILRNGDDAHALIDTLEVTIAPQQIRCLNVSDLPMDTIAVHVSGTREHWTTNKWMIAEVIATVHSCDDGEHVNQLQPSLICMILETSLRIVPVHEPSLFANEGRVSAVHSELAETP
jgi:hypothetical protein